MGQYDQGLLYILSSSKENSKFFQNGEVNVPVTGINVVTGNKRFREKDRHGH